MKKIILFTAILLAGVSVAEAQEKTKATSETETLSMAVLKVYLHNFISIILNSDDTYVDLVYRTAEDYDGAGVSALKEDHLIVSSLTGFTVKVNSSTTSSLSDEGIALNIEGAGVTIKAERGTTRGMDGAAANLVVLSSNGVDKQLY